MRPVTPLQPGYMARRMNPYSKSRAVTDSIVPPPLNVSPRARDREPYQTRQSGQDRKSGTKDSLSSSTDSLLPKLRASDGVQASLGIEVDSRQVQSTPVPSTHSTPLLQVFSPEDDRHSASSPATDADQRSRPNAIVLGDGRMSPTRSGTFGRLGNVKIVSAQRVPSMEGLVSHVGSFDNTTQPSPSSLYSDLPSGVCRFELATQEADPFQAGRRPASAS